MSPIRGDSLIELLALMERLRGEGGCPWDRAQTFASIAPHTIEEAYEVADAAQRGDLAHLKDELGDLLFQVVFNAQLARESGHFDFDGIARAICDKLIRRHPQVFAAADGSPALSIAEQSTVWENIKAVERAAGTLDGVPLALPALQRAYKLSKRAARVGFDFAHASETADKVAEELAEVREAMASSRSVAGGSAPSPETAEEIGDLLFAAANLARKLGVDAETALRAANAKFERRFREMERIAALRGPGFDTLDLAAQEALWQEVKRGE